MAKYPVWAAGEDITADKIAAGLPEIVVSDADQTVNNSTVLVSSTELTTTLAANAIYEVQFQLFYETPAAANFKTAWSVPSGATGLKWAVGLGTATTDTTPQGDIRCGVHAFTTTINYGDRNSTNQVFAWEGAIITTTNAGTLVMQFAQNGAVVGDTTLHDGSYLKVQRLA